MYTLSQLYDVTNVRELDFDMLAETIAASDGIEPYEINCMAIRDYIRICRVDGAIQPFEKRLEYFNNLFGIFINGFEEAITFKLGVSTVDPRMKFDILANMFRHAIVKYKDIAFDEKVIDSYIVNTKAFDKDRKFNGYCNLLLLFINLSRETDRQNSLPDVKFGEIFNRKYSYLPTDLIQYATDYFHGLDKLK